MNRINAYDSFEIVSSKQVFENIRKNNNARGKEIGNISETRET